MRIYKRVKLSEIADVYSYVSYTKKILQDKSFSTQKKVSVSKYVTPYEQFTSVERKIKEGNICVLISDNPDLMYFINLVLDSLVGRIHLLNDGCIDSYKKAVTVKAIRDFEIVLPPSEILTTAVYLHHAIETVVSLCEKEPKKNYSSAVKSLMEELRDDFILELYYPNIFDKFSISIVDKLSSLVNINEPLSITDATMTILEALIDNEGDLLKNMRRLRILINEIPTSEKEV